MKRMKDIKRADIDAMHRERVSLKAEIERLNKALTEAQGDIDYYVEQLKHWMDLAAQSDAKLKCLEQERDLLKRDINRVMSEATQAKRKASRYEWMIDHIRVEL